MTTPQRLDDAVSRIDLIRNEINKMIRELPDSTPMFAIVDIVNALWNLRNASVLLDKATDTLEADQGCADLHAQCELCEGAERVKVTTGRWNYTVPCPDCCPMAFCEAGGLWNNDHVIFGPAR